MNFFVQFLEVIAFLVPDFFVLGLAAAAFFSLYCIAKVCGLTGTADVDSGFGIALILAYFVTIAVNVASHLLTPARSRIAADAQPESQSAQSGRESPAEKLRAPSVEQEGMFTAP